MRLHAPLLVLPALLAACAADPLPEPAPPPPPPPPPPVIAPPPPAYSGLGRADFNRDAVRANLPIYWAEDTNKDGAVDPGEIAALLFYPTEGRWVSGGAFTPEFAAAWQKIRASGAPVPGGADPESARKALVLADLDQGLPTLVAADFHASSEEDKTLVRHMLKVARMIDELFATQNGAKSLIPGLAGADDASRSLFRRNWGPRCAAPMTENNPACSALPGSPQPLIDAYPPDMQKDPKFCVALEKLPNAKALLAPFVAIRANAAGKLEPAPLSKVYAETMGAVSRELAAAAEGVVDPSELPLKTYLAAASKSFTTNDWLPADEAWSKMSATNSKWYVRVAPDEVYWEPCNHKAGFHLTFARINRDSLAWQTKLAPVEQDMEKDFAARVGAAYKARKVTFHLPDFIDIVVNAGDDRNAIGATIGESLPNWGPVAAQGRGRTVAMSNLYTDADSLAIRRSQAESLLSKETAAAYVDSAEPGLLDTILHEATHNLGPTTEYKVAGRNDEQAFGGQLASMLEELKAQTGALYYVDFLVKRGMLTPEQAKETYTSSIIWACGHISRGMYTETHGRKAYSQLAAIQVGFLMDEGAITWDDKTAAANGTDTGAFTIHFDKMPGAIEKLMKVVGLLKATNDKATAEKLSKKYVDGATVPQKAITQRELKFPKQSFVYSVVL